MREKGYKLEEEHLEPPTNNPTREDCFSATEHGLERSTNLFQISLRILTHLAKVGMSRNFIALL
jgi:hypothetical protein